jgi:uncharacterized protein YecT (DUF1311 family)
VGRGGDWNIPTAPGIVAQYDPFGLRIKVENLPAAVGSSGGPLISATGIVGMIIVDSSLATEATPIEPIRRQVRDVWRYDWRLAPASAGNGGQGARPQIVTTPQAPEPRFPQRQPPPPQPPAMQPSSPVREMPPLVLNQVPLITAPPVRRGPSYLCSDARAPVEVLICQDDTLAGLDVELSDLYRSTQSRLSTDRRQQLVMSQRGWIKDRNDCVRWTGSSAVRDCVARAYRDRIVELRSF